ncbi:hypothetical protein SMU40_06785 [Streptococcus mutans 15VF2]|nr:hypothetical protein SMU40_06785 [Streptococcus mutans 15VF2]
MTNFIYLFYYVNIFFKVLLLVDYVLIFLFCLNYKYALEKKLGD